MNHQCDLHSQYVIFDNSPAVRFPRRERSIPERHSNSSERHHSRFALPECFGFRFLGRADRHFYLVHHDFHRPVQSQGVLRRIRSSRYRAQWDVACEISDLLAACLEAPTHISCSGKVEFFLNRQEGSRVVLVTRSRLSRLAMLMSLCDTN